MASTGARLVFTVVFLGLSTFGWISILGMGERNGFFAMMGGEGLDLSGERKVYAGWAPMDEFLATLVRFFYPCASGENPALSVLSAYFAGQWISVHCAMVLEGLRAGNRGRAVGFPATTVWGMVYNGVPVGVIMGLYCTTHLWTSPLARLSSKPGSPSAASLLSVDGVALRSVTGAVTLGLVVPTLLAGLAVFVSADLQRTLLAIWQFFPALTTAWFYALAALVRAFALVPQTVQTGGPATRLRYARRVYRYALALTGVVHAACFAAIFVPALRADGVSLGSVFVPMSVSSPRQVSGLAEGSLTLLQYDMACSVSTALVWVTYLAGWAAPAKGAGGLVAAAATLAKAAGRSVLVGPGGAVLWAFWDRDELALENAATVEKSGKKSR